MSITLRYPDGTRETFNSPVNVRDNGRGLDLVDANNQHWYAIIPPATNVVIESVEPCRIETKDKPTIERAIRTLLGSTKLLRRADFEDLKLLKRELAKFNAHTGEWR